MTAPRRFAALLGLAFPLGWLAASPAWASGDLCEPRWRIETASLGECDTIAALTPGNDTRANLLMLLFDRHGLPASPPAATAKPILGWRDYRDAFAPGGPPNGSTYAAGEGSRCRTNDGGTATFDAAVDATAALPPEEHAALASARASLKPDCAAAPASGAPAAPPPVPSPVAALTAAVRSEAGRGFATYLRGTEAFYAARFDDAERAFELERTSPLPWLADTAAYMVARTGVNRLQADAFDDYGTLKDGFVADPAAAARVEASLDAYLAAHPDGRYAVSARGLLRRVDWLAGWTEKLAGRYAALMARPAAARGIDDLSLVEEIDAKLLPRLTPAMTRDPLLLAVMDLKAMRRSDAKPGAPPVRPDLDGQRDAFAALPALHAFLLASAAFAVDGATAPVLGGLADDTRRRDGDYLWFSRQFLRGQALEAAGDRNARGFWRELAPGAGRPLTRSLVELALALHDQARGRLDDVFAPDSLVTDPTMRAILLERVAGPALLRARARDSAGPERERAVALFTLLYKGVTRGAYADVLGDLADVPPGAAAAGDTSPGVDSTEVPPLGVFARGESAGEIGCPPLPATVAKLAAEPDSVRDRLCLAEFVRLNGMDGDSLDRPLPKGDLGGVPSAFPGRPYARSATYAAIIADRAAPADDRAYALYRAVRCYEPSGNTQCGGPDAPKATRHGWYDALRRDYPGSRWAKRLSLWW